MVVTVARETVAIDANQPPLYDAQDMTKGASTARIKLGNQIYTLRITRAGKLILTK